MTDTVAEIIALGRAARLTGFEMPVAKVAKPVVPPSSRPPESALATATRLGLPGFGNGTADDVEGATAPEGVTSTVKPPQESTFAAATRLGLPGFALAAPTPVVTGTSPATPAAAPAAIPPVAKPVTRQPFVIVDVAAAGGAAALTSLETKMRMPFAASIGGKAAWLERGNPDGSQTRAYPAMGREIDQLRDLAGPVSGSALRISVGPISRSEFSVRTTAGPLAAGERPSVGYGDAALPGALRQALAR